MTIDLSELPARLQDLRDALRVGSGVTLTDGGVAVGTVAPTPPEKPRQRIFGMHPGAFEMAPDFDDPLPDEFWLGG